MLRIFPDETELLIACAECGDELRHFLVPLQATEAFDGIEDAGGDPAYYRLPATPALDVALHVTGSADEGLRRVRLVDDPVDWPWSGYAAIAGLRPNPGFLFSDPILQQFGDGDTSVLRDRYRQHVLGPADDDIEERLRSKEGVVGDRAFKRQLREGREGTANRQLGGRSTFDRGSRRFMPL